jgi:signal transduction histidine kinase
MDMASVSAPALRQRLTALHDGIMTLTTAAACTPAMAEALQATRTALQEVSAAFPPPQARQRVQHFGTRGRVAVELSHDIQNPLGTVSLFLDVVEDECQRPSPDSPAVLTDACGEIRTALGYVRELVEEYSVVCAGLS